VGTTHLRPPLAIDRPALTSSGQVRYTLKTAYRDGTTHIVLVPRPRMHLTRYHGVRATQQAASGHLTGHARQGREETREGADKSSVPRYVAMSWSQRRNHSSRVRRVAAGDRLAAGAQGFTVRHWAETDRGGHFLEWEEPELVARDIQTFFRELRQAECRTLIALIRSAMMDWTDRH
jgi:pimeloyl-ACP methyl ester carboxylesterase